MIVLALALSGCAWLGDPGGVSRALGGRELGKEAFRQARLERLVADDLVRVLAQIDPASPAAGPVLMSPPRAAFGQSLLLAMRRAGYRVEIDTDPRSERYVRYNVESIQNQFGSSQGYQIALGDVALARDYSFRQTGVFPLSRLRVEGASSLNLILDDRRFRRQDADEIMVTGLMPDPRFDDARALSGNPGDVPIMFDARGRAVVDKQQVARNNVYEARQSSFSGYLERFEPVSRKVLSFPNDSIRVVPDSHAALRQLSADFNPDTDVFSVIGCSHGVTALPNGNAVLAEGRSQRVLEELVDLGVPESLVLEEGCWAKLPFEKMPARGVVVELKRRRPS